jgi:hypothetical protein
MLINTRTNKFTYTNNCEFVVCVCVCERARVSFLCNIELKNSNPRFYPNKWIFSLLSLNPNIIIFKFNKSIRKEKNKKMFIDFISIILHVHIMMSYIYINTIKFFLLYNSG